MLLIGCARKEMHPHLICCRDRVKISMYIQDTTLRDRVVFGFNLFILQLFYQPLFTIIGWHLFNQKHSWGTRCSSTKATHQAHLSFRRYAQICIACVMYMRRFALLVLCIVFMRFMCCNLLLLLSGPVDDGSWNSVTGFCWTLTLNTYFVVRSLGYWILFFVWSWVPEGPGYWLFILWWDPGNHGS